MTAVVVSLFVLALSSLILLILTIKQGGPPRG